MRQISGTRSGACDRPNRGTQTEQHKTYTRVRNRVVPGPAAATTLGWKADLGPDTKSAMERAQSVLMMVRLRVTAAVVCSFFAALAPLLLFGWEGLWWAKILMIGGAPFLGITAITAFTFAGAILRRPLVWAGIASATAITVSSVGLWLLTGSAIGLASLPIALLATVIFVFAIKVLAPLHPTGSAEC